ncbi:MAG TPA: hypothetical protein VHG28_11435 [Longimicrobiaceae bacterium]|nr:hypothetical protein [Longimicrobiaceae bacterium]
MGSEIGKAVDIFVGVAMVVVLAALAVGAGLVLALLGLLHFVGVEDAEGIVFVAASAVSVPCLLVQAVKRFVRLPASVDRATLRILLAGAPTAMVAGATRVILNLIG